MTKNALLLGYILPEGKKTETFIYSSVLPIGKKGKKPLSEVKR